MGALIMPRTNLDDLIRRLSGRGLQEDAAEVGELSQAVESLRRPPGVIGRWTTAARVRVSQQWRLAVDEWTESCQALQIVRERVVSGRTLEAAEVDALRSQFIDLVKTLPAGVVAAATAVTPVPGAMLLTPWVLSRLNLLPSRWREQAVLDRLRRESARLRECGESGGADALDAVAAELEDDCRTQDEAARRSTLLTHWDLNGDGVVDADERAAYTTEVERLIAAREAVGAARRWYVGFGGEIAGPVRWQDIEASGEPAMDVIVCLDGESGWVRLDDLRAAAASVRA